MEKHAEKPAEKHAEKPLENKYLESLSEKERKSYEIAKDHLGMSFQLDKSIGYLNWYRANYPSS